MKENNDINLCELEVGKEIEILHMIEQDQGLRNTFGAQVNTHQRFANSVYSAFIRNKETTVGFIMIIYNGRTNKYEIDMGILEQYRGMGYGTKAMELMKEVILINDLKVDVQIKKTNVHAIRTVLSNNFVLDRQDEECNYYTLPTENKHIK